MTTIERLALHFHNRIEKDGLRQVLKALSVACNENGRYIVHATRDKEHPTAESWCDIAISLQVLAIEAKQQGISEGVLSDPLMVEHDRFTALA